MSKGKLLQGSWILALILFAVLGATAVYFWQSGLLRPLANQEVGTVGQETRAETTANPPAQGGESAVEDQYVTSDACRKCHEEEHDSWHLTYHRTMTQKATPDSVVAPFDNVRLESRGRSYELERRGDEFWVTMANPEWEERLLMRGVDPGYSSNPPRAARKIVRTTGSHLMQTYWVEAPDGLRQLPWFYHIAEQRWIPSEDSFLRPPDADRIFERWDASCIKCHAVHGVPGFDFQSSFRSQVAELGIACEACHGPGGEHVRLRESQPGARGETLPAGVTDPIVNPARCDHDIGSQVCGQCHGSQRPRDPRDWLANGSRFRPGRRLEEHFDMVRFDNPDFQDDYYIQYGYWQDGTCRTGGDEYLGMSASPCFQRGKLSCFSCHSMHAADPTDQLKPDLLGDESCLQCHDELRGKVEQHTHHKAASSGSQCLNCHMPHTSYALYKAIRSHRIDSPDVAIEVRRGRPNACNLCHLDQTLAWSSSKLTEWYGQGAVELDEPAQKTAAAVVTLLRGDAVQRVLVAWHLGWKEGGEASGTDWQAAYLSFLLDDPYSAVRFVAYESLRKLPGYEGFVYDFLAPPDERAAAKQRLLEQWQNRPGRRAPPAAAQLLLDDTGLLRRAEVDALLLQRDNRPVGIPE